MTDRHVLVLRVVARHRQRQLDDLIPVDAVSMERRRDLERAAARASARLGDAQARRRLSRG
jgi:hypothetical protein